MDAFIKPLVYGITTACIAIMGLWLAIPLFLSALSENWVAWYPFLIVVPPLVLGGYVSARKMRSKYVHRYLVMGGAVGIVVLVRIWVV
jgi:hypothetical protein